MARRFFPKKRRGKTTLRKAKVPRVSNKHLTKMVKSIMTRQAEKKVFNYTFPTNYVMGCYGGTSFATSGITPISPYPGIVDIVQGVASNQRVGNSITITSAKLRLMFTPYIYDAVYNTAPPLMVISVVLYYQRQEPNNFGVILPGFYQNGGTADAPSATGALYDTMKPFNNDRYKVFKRKVFKLGYALAGTGANAAYSNNSNNDYKQSQKVSIDFTKYLIKKQRYDDNLGLPIGSRGLYMAVFISSGDGRALNAPVNQRYAYMNGVIDYKYTDI